MDATGARGRTGLSDREAAGRLARDGPNTLPAERGVPAWRALAAQMLGFFALMLWGAAVLAVLAGMPQLGAAIAAVVVVNGLFAFWQEHRAERAAQALGRLLPQRVRVVRGGRAAEVDAAEVVTGDLVLVEAGDRVPADARLLTAHGLAVDTSILTGESVPAPLQAGDEVAAGTFAVEGEGEAVVTATGGRTRLAGIAALTRSAPRPASPLARELRRLVRTIAAIAAGVGVAFFVASVLVGGDVADGLVFAIGVTVALVPEGLLPTVTLSLAIGAQHMARRHALVRRLEAVETLGSTSFICTDKTGTLTENRMAVVRAWTPAGEVRVRGEGYAPDAEVEGAPAALDAVRRLAVVAVRCSRGRAVERDGAWVAVGDPMEAALDALGRRVGAPVEVDAAGDPEAARHPFDPRRRRMSVVTGARVLVKGAPGAVLPRCAPAPGAAEAHREMAAAGLRVLAVAARAREGAGDARDPQTAESGLTLLGLVGLEDPPRAHAAAAVAACRAAGIRVAMVTGDHPLTARAIAREVGLLGPEGLVVEGRDLPADDLALGDLVDADGVVVSRVSPEDKLRIARVLRERGHVVAMTGDGVNDGPALRQADIGVAMGRGGSDVAREAADLVLLDDDFATVVAAVEQGRATHRNVRRFLTYHLTDNVAELTPFVVWALSGGRFPLAIGVMQVLALDLVTDSLPAVALGAEPARPGVLKSAPSHGRLLDAPLARRVFGVLGPAEAALGMAAFIAGLLAAGWRPGAAFPAGPALAAASGGAWLAIVAGQAGNALACRSAHITPWRLGWGGNRLLVAAVGVEMTAALLLVLVPPLAALLDQAAPPAAGWVVVLLAAPVMIGVDAAHKALRRRRG